MRIKKDNQSKNEYIKVNQVWVRNFTKPTNNTLDLNNLFGTEDYRQIVINENANHNFSRSSITGEALSFAKVLIVSDGFGFDKKHLDLLSLPKDVAIFAVNGALSKWKLIAADPKQRRPINLYVVNNPYKECLEFLPKKAKYYPTCVASTRTHVEFTSGYAGNLYFYEPSRSKDFGGDYKDAWYVDDYRNPICAAINLAYRFGAYKIGLFCCDESFTEERPGAVQLKNKLWHYPQHQMLHEVIDANFYWLKQHQNYEIQLANCSSGPEYKHAAYIEDVVALTQFFDEPQ